MIEQTNRTLPKQQVCGFMMNLDKLWVLMIKKNRPDWMIGKLNGIGGSVEDSDDSYPEAMAREFQEETGIFTAPSDWFEFLELHTDHHTIVHFFVSYQALSFMHMARSLTDEKPEVCEISALEFLETLPGICWQIRMALSFGRGEDCAKFIVYEVKAEKPIETGIEGARVLLITPQQQVSPTGFVRSVWLSQRLAGAKDYEGWWTCPGGRIEPGETPIQAAIREVFEETGLEVTEDSTHSLGSTMVARENGSQIRMHEFCIELNPDQVPLRTEPEKQGGWFKFVTSALPSRMPPGVTDLVNRTLRFRE